MQGPDIADTTTRSAPSSDDDTAHLIDVLVSHGRALVRTEWSLAQRELQRAGRSIVTSAILFASALLLVLVAFHALAVAAVLGLMALGLPGWLAALATTAAVIVLAFGCALIGKARLTARHLKPRRTLSNLKSDFATVKESFRA
ncbi:phage holin family protein [Primorskyibacter sp. S187A]|uniref:phage holin family protein n=1 Tax=Primorskyibacter sp. S187A TaxID=3415130 RepID=UPI003C7ECE65